MKTFGVRRTVLAALLIPAAVALWGCNESTAPPDGSADPVSAVENTQWSGSGTAASDAEQAPTASGIQAAPSATQEGTLADGIRWHREITSWTRTHVVSKNEAAGTATVTVIENRTGILHLRSNDGVTLDRPFSDHGERIVALERTPHRLWRVTAASIMDRWPTSLEVSPITIDYVQLDFSSGVQLRVDNPTAMIDHANWLRLFAGQTVVITVKVGNVGDSGARVFLHDRFGGELHRSELTQATTNATLFSGTFVVPSSLGRPGDFRPILPLGIRFFTVDAVQASTLTMDPAAVYNARQWVVPFLYRPDVVASH